MFILNIDEIPTMQTFKCGKLVADWLIKEKHIPLIALTKDGKKYVFKDNDLLREILKQKPLHLKILDMIFE